MKIQGIRLTTAEVQRKSKEEKRRKYPMGNPFNDLLETESYADVLIYLCMYLKTKTKNVL